MSARPLPFQVRELAHGGPRKLFAQGFVINLQNPKIAMLYLALLPRFVDPDAGLAIRIAMEARRP